MRKVLPLLFLLFTISVVAQKEANFWYFGQNAALDFNSGSPVPVGDIISNRLNTVEGCSTFSDVDGNLLFYIGAPNPGARNLTIWNRNNEPMPFSDVDNGGQVLNGDSSSSQSALTVPAPGQPNIYYVFTVGAQAPGNNAGFWYYTVDMTADGGLGDVVAGPTPLNDGTPLSIWTEKVTAVRGEECNTFWVISYVQGNFIAYKVDDSGVDVANPVLSNLGNTSFNDSGAGAGGLDPRGYLKVSPDGSKLVAAHMTSGVFLFDFDDSTGLVSNPRELNVDNRNAYGVEFSPSSRRLYVSTGNFQPTAEFLYQYDVTTDDINTINASRFTVHTYFNTRGALQLGPDNKVYWTSDQSQFISVVNSPEELGADVNYEHQIVDVGVGRVATQGLPPFLSSLLLPIDIRDSDTNQVLNDQTIAFCTGDNKTITPQSITGSNISYAWSFDDGSGPSVIATTQSLSLNNLSSANDGLYSLEIILTDDCGINTTLNGEFTIQVFENARAKTNVEEILFCDENDNDGFNTFDLSTLKDAEILDGQDPAVFAVRYFLTEAEAISNSNPIAIPYTNPTAFSDQTIWARVQNSNATLACFDVTSFRLAVTGSPTPTTPIDYVICDDTSVGTDSDGFVNSFLLNTKDAEILGSLSASQYQVSYHLSATDADANSNPIDKNSSYTNISANSQEIFVRVENVDNAACYDASVQFNLIVGTLPVLENNVINIEECDFDGVLDGRANVNLTQITDLVSLNATSFKYYPSLGDAQSDSNEITDPVNFRNDAPNYAATNFSYWVRALSDLDCFRISRVDVLVSAVGAFQPPSLVTEEECDDFLDTNGNDNASNDDTDGITTFNLSQFIPAIRAEFPANENIQITFYRSQRDADLKDNPITNPAAYRNIGFPNSQTIYVRADNVDQNTCEGVFAYLQLNVLPAPTATAIGPLTECDDDDDGLVSFFNLDSQTNAILGAQNPANFIVTYHITRQDAATGDNAIANTSAYTNTTRDRQTIFVRVENRTTGCAHDRISFDLIVNPQPIVSAVDDLPVCDDDNDTDAQNGFSQNINLELRTPDVLGSLDPNNHTVTYHHTLANAQQGLIPLVSPFSNSIANRQTIYVRVLNNTTQCANTSISFDVVINPEPTNEIVTPLEECDNDLNGEDDTDGFVQNFDLESKIPEILGATQDPADFIVTFHETPEDAQMGTGPLSSPYTNTQQNRQRIYVRIENRATNCVNDKATFEVVVNPLPEFDVNTPQIICLNTNGITLRPENPAGSYDYVWTNLSNGDRTNGEELFVDAPGTYRITGTTIDGTQCSRSYTVTVNPSNVATILRKFVTIYDESNNNGIDEGIFISIDTVNNNLGPGDYQYAILNTETGARFPVSGYQNEPRFENLEGGVYRILVNDRNGCGPDATLDVSVIQFPKFFTPNGDNENDTWSVRGANRTFFPNSRVLIFNRFGKVVANLPIDGPGWDGTFNGKILPSDDYWFSVRLIEPNGAVRERKGNFSLIRGSR